MPTAMSYAIDTLLRLCEENTRLRMRLGEKPSSEVENIKLEVKETSEEKNWATLQNIPTELVKQYLAEECCFHIYDKPPATLEEVERLKESADLIAEAQQKQISCLLEDKRERMEDREKLLKDIKSYQIQLHQLSDAMLETKQQLKRAEEKVAKAVGANVGRPKKTECSPCIADPSSP
jgi:hypothetical protein